MNARTVAFVYHRTHQEWKTLEEAMMIVDDPDVKQGIAKEIEKRRQNANKIGEMLEKFEVDVEDEQV
ncbi:hypothetical protein PPK13_gp04 [Bacillus phage Ray17]|uniref:Uncharacterized protein n=1 Tax=Bacillus phage Ray17 TaxID=2315627 RepID=A0A386K9G5_9CAUD|nr:hypothetical protein PPK13_gp04 [Bacillus phage Ray17]AYD80906.1 hypothetical protein Ray17_5 [Bacillus phage Ray17]